MKEKGKGRKKKGREGKQAGLGLVSIILNRKLSLENLAVLKSLNPGLVSVSPTHFNNASCCAEELWEISVSYYDVNLFFNHIKLDCYSGMQANKSPDISPSLHFQNCPGVATQPPDPGDEGLGIMWGLCRLGLEVLDVTFILILTHGSSLSVRRWSLTGQLPLNNSKLRKWAGTLCHFPSFTHVWEPLGQFTIIMFL